MKFLIILAIPYMLLASGITLDEILNKLKYEHPMAKSIKAYKSAYISDNKAKSSREAIVFNTDATLAKPDLDEDGYEYSVGLEQSFINPTVKANISKSFRYKNDAEILKLKNDFLLLKNDVGLLYHINCLDRKTTKQYKDAYLAFETLYTKKQKAYKYGEISKKEILQLKIELNRLKGNFKHYKNEEKKSRNNLQAKILLPVFKEEILSCTDIYEIKGKLLFSTTEESMQEQALNKRIQSVSSDFNRYDTLFDSFSVSAQYQNEIDTKRISVGLSLPLSFTSSINEENRAVAMYKQSALEHKKQAVKLKRESEIESLQNQLFQAYEDIELVSSMLKSYENELMPLIEMGYRLGEDSAIEYLLSKREMWMYKKNLIQNYKYYYETLFKLYSVLEIKG